jgi:hypothetical protein
MANGSGADIDGNGSVRWEVVTGKDDGDRFQTTVVNKRRTAKGVDDGADGAGSFTIVLKVPEDGSAPKFLAQFTSPPVDGKITLELNLERRNQQIHIGWPQIDGKASVTST